AVAGMHAYRMTHFGTDANPAEGRPEALSWPTKVKLLVTGRSPPRPENAGTPADAGLPFEVHRFASDPGVEIEAWFVPRAEPRGPVLLFPGYSASKQALLPEAAALHALGYAPFLVDFRGCGGSSGSVTSLGIHEANDVAAAVDYARGHWPGRPTVLYGV